jgi:hypothetical protein
VLKLVSFSAALPTRAMFAVVWRLVLHRARTVWNSAHWARYFVRTYLRRTDLLGETALTASWYYGAGAMLPRGAVPSQQPVEQSHAAAKRALRSLPPNATLPDVLEAWRGTLASWCAPPDDDSECPGTLKANRDNLGVFPRSPDDWMYAASGTLYVPALQRSERCMGIPAFLLAMTADPTHWQVLNFETTIFHALGLFRSEPIPEGWLRLALRQIWRRKPTDLLNRWVGMGFAIPRDPEANPAEPLYKLELKALCTFWNTAALVLEKPSGIVCTCVMWCSRGHCVHKYIIEELTGKNRRFGHLWPTAATGAQALRAAQRYRSAAPLASPELEAHLRHLF